MKSLVPVVVLGIALAGVSLTQPSAKGSPRADRSDKTRIAVVEFTPGPNASVMTAEAKRQLQASIAFALTESGRFDVHDVRRTREATQGILPALNGVGPTSDAVKVGKQLGVSHVLTGMVTEYDTKEGQATLRTRLIEVATGKVTHSGETSHQSTSAMTARAGAAEMMSKVLKPCIEKLMEKLAALGS